MDPVRLKANNVYGQIVAPGGLGPILAALEQALGPGCASLFHPRPGAPEMVRVRTDTADLESLPLPGGMEHLFNGAVAGPIDDVIAFARSLSTALAEAKVEHTLEVHDGRRIVLSLPTP
jgi:hypothetical protein